MATGVILCPHTGQRVQGWFAAMLQLSARVIALGVMLVGLPTAQAADTTLTLACKGKQTSGVGARSETATTMADFLEISRHSIE
jgi:hypothetical protein